MTADALHLEIVRLFVAHWPEDRAGFLDAVRAHAGEPAYPDAMARAYATIRDAGRRAMFQCGDVPADVFRAIAEHDHAQACGQRKQ